MALMQPTLNRVFVAISTEAAAATTKQTDNKEHNKGI